MTHQSALPDRPTLTVGPPVLVISPHLDDAVFGCGELLAACPGSVVVTVMAGRPAQYAACTPWDALAGFREGDDVVAARREEDRAALALLAGRPVWLDFLDSQYRDSPTIEAIAVALEAAILDSGLETILLPLGLFHSDHHLTHAAALAVVRRRPERSWFAYEDALYRRVANLGTARLAALQGDGVDAVPVAVPPGDRRETKRQAMQRYASQLRALATPGKPGYEDALEPERYWRLALLSPPIPGAPGRRPDAGGDRAG
jgi:LmbE family N-acetylglucosaminyl deacetylase